MRLASLCASSLKAGLSDGSLFLLLLYSSDVQWISPLPENSLHRLLGARMRVGRKEKHGVGVGY
jgi:hypothetical protein